MNQVSSGFDTFLNEYESKSNIYNCMTGDVELNRRNFFAKLDELGYKLDELGLVISTNGNMLVLSSAGSGKTTAMVLKLIHDYITGEFTKWQSVPSADGGTNSYPISSRVLVSTFLKTGAGDLKRAFSAWCYRLGIYIDDSEAFQFRTMHSEFYDLLTKVGVKLNMQSDAESDAALKRVLNKYSIRAIASKSRTITNDELRDIACIITYARNKLDETRYMHPLMSDFALDGSILELILTELKTERRRKNVVDFEDLQELLYEAAQTNESLRQFIADRYDYLFIDEFQDTAQIQYELIKLYAAQAKKIVAIGDDDQTIYSWRGSDIKIILERFAQDFNPAICALTTNYRTASCILNPIISSIEKNKRRHPKQIKAYNEGGELRILTTSDVDTLVQSVRDDLKTFEAIGILGRTNADLLMPAIILELDGGIDFSVSKSVGLQSRIPRTVFGLIDLITKRYNDNFEDYIKLFLPRYNFYEAETLLSMLKLNKSCSIYNVADEDIKYSVPKLYPLLSDLREFYKAGEKVKAYLYLLDLLQTEVFTGSSAYARRAYDFARMTKELVLNHSALKGRTLEDIDSILNDHIGDSLNRRIQKTKAMRISLSTVHEAKGKEWDSVYIWNDTDGVFPAQVGNRELSEEEYEEERRVHYIAWTRPRTKLSVFTSITEASPFLLECNLPEGVRLNGGENVFSTQLSVGAFDEEREKVKRMGKNVEIVYDSRKDGYNRLVEISIETGKYLSESDDIMTTQSVSAELISRILNNPLHLCALKERLFNRYSVCGAFVMGVDALGNNLTSRKDDILRVFLEELQQTKEDFGL